MVLHGKETDYQYNVHEKINVHMIFLWKKKKKKKRRRRKKTDIRHEVYGYLLNLHTYIKMHLTMQTQNGVYKNKLMSVRIQNTDATPTGKGR